MKETGRGNSSSRLNKTKPGGQGDFPFLLQLNEKDHGGKGQFPSCHGSPISPVFVCSKCVQTREKIPKIMKNQLKIVKKSK
jgi:hypothetical protein